MSGLTKCSSVIGGVMVSLCVAMLACTEDGELLDGAREDWPYEQHGAALSVECVEDLSGDGEVGMDDLIILLAAWGECLDCPADLNNDNDVGMADLTALLGKWGTCPGDVPFITPGNGFSGPTPQPPAVGSPGQSGYDAKVIGFMNFVPGHTITSYTKIGVVVFHINGINRVEAMADGGPVEVVTEMTFNEQSGCWEYTFAVDPATWADGQHEIRFIAYPNVGIPAILDFDYTFNSEIVGDIEVGLPIYTNAGGTINDEVRYVNPNGGSNNNNGRTPGSAMATINAAIASIKYAQGGSLGGATVYLAHGNYAVPGDSAGTGGRWFTLAGAPGTNRNNVVLGSGSGNGFPNARFRIKDLKVYGVEIGRGRAIWNDACHLEGNNPNFNSTQPNSLQKNVALHYVNGQNTNEGYPDGIFTVAPGGRTCDHWHIYEPFQRHTLIRNVYVNNMSRDINREGRYGINVFVENAGAQGAHADFFHWFASDIDGLDTGESPGAAENFCFVNYRVHCKHTGVQWMQRASTIESRFDRAAFVNLEFWRVPETHTADGGWFTTSNHVLLWNLTVVNASAEINTQSNRPASHFKNWSIRGGSWHRMELAGTLAQVAEIRENHYWNDQISGNPPTAFSGGINASTGDPKYTNVNSPGTGGLTPGPGSPLLGGTNRPYPADTANMPRAQMTAKGARRGVTEAP